MFDRAIQEYTRLFREKNDLTNLRNRGLVYLFLRDYTSALTDFNQVISLEEPNFISDMDYILQGVCHWYLNHPDQAIKTWEKSINTPFTDAAGGVKSPALLLYAGTRLSDGELKRKSIQLLRRKWQNYQRRIKRRETRYTHTHSDFVYEGLSGWPGVIVPFLLGKARVDEIETVLENIQNKSLEARWRCQADFYIGLKALIDGDKDAFQTRMHLSSESKFGYLEHEYYLARWELERGFSDQPFG